jgi:hypothetical protein
MEHFIEYNIKYICLIIHGNRNLKNKIFFLLKFIYENMYIHNLNLKLCKVKYLLDLEIK